MIVNTEKLFKAAYGRYAIGAYNINNLEQTVGLFKGMKGCFTTGGGGWGGGGATVVRKRWLR